jgi:hypothetical protein
VSILNQAQLTAKVNNMEEGLAAILAHLGLSTETPTPRDTAGKLPTGKGQRKYIETEDSEDDGTTRITITDAMESGRMKLPKAMFGTKTLIKIGNAEFDQQENDNGRSSKFSPSIFGAESGDTVVFTFDRKTKSAMYYDFEVEKARKSRKAKAHPETSGGKLSRKVGTSKAKAPSRDADDDGGDVSWDDILKETAKAAIRGGRKGHVNENIANTSKFEDDPRIFLTSAQHQKFRKAWKNEGMKLGQAVKQLSALVYE